MLFYRTCSAETESVPGFNQKTEAAWGGPRLSGPLAAGFVQQEQLF